MIRKESKQQHSFSQNLELWINILDAKIDKMINTYLEGLIVKEIFLNKKNELLKRRIGLQEPLLAGQGGSF